MAVGMENQFCSCRKKQAGHRKGQLHQGSTKSNLLVDSRASHDPQHRLQVLGVAAHGPGAEEAGARPQCDGELPVVGDHSCKQGEVSLATSRAPSTTSARWGEPCSTTVSRCSSGVARQGFTLMPWELAAVPWAPHFCSRNL